MADPRKTVLNTDVEGPTRTYKIDNSTIVYDKTKTGGSAQVGFAVTFSADDVVKLTEDGEAVVGRLELVEADNFCVVRVNGPVSLPGGDSATLTLGKKIVGDLGVAGAKGYIREVATATAAELGVARGRIVNNNDTAAVVVEL
ncbi:MAG: hypothetical protein L0229_22535 [Blastocatellia bacterium]|nr:hypothetical protein [Blastocatellia bacterium]